MEGTYWEAILGRIVASMMRFLIKTNAQGDMQWSKVYGESGIDTVLSVLQTKDGGYIWAGDSSSFGSGGYDFWVVRTDTSGNMIWNKTYGGPSDDVADQIISTIDGGYAVIGSTWSYFTIKRIGGW